MNVSLVINRHKFDVVYAHTHKVFHIIYIKCLFIGILCQINPNISDINKSR